MIKIGITGGIGSGKTTISTLLKAMGFPVFDADTESKLLCNTNVNLKQELIDAFGRGIYEPSGNLNRGAFAAVIFNDNAKLQLANSIIHPHVIAEFFSWAGGQQQHLVFVESAILLECSLQSHVDKIVVVTAPEPTRIRRVMLREGVGAPVVEARIKNQLPERVRISLADYVVYNDDKSLVIPQVEEIVASLA